MARPLKLDGTSGLIEMTDAQLDSLCYYLRVAYAAQLNASGDGYIAISGTGTSIGSASDTSSTQQQASNPRNNNAGDGTDYPAAPGIGTETDTTYSYTQDRTTPTFPSTTILDADGYIITDGSSGIRVVNTEAQIYNEVIAQTITDIRTGDEVGSYRVATTTPAGGTWVSKGVFFADTTYSAGTTNYNLYLKTAATPPTENRPVILDGTSGVQEVTGTWNENTAMIQNVLLPCLTRRVTNGDLQYTVITSAITGVDRGSWTDTRQTTSSDVQEPFVAPTYFTTSTPTGAATTITTYRLNLS